jgi:Leucine-rich repeat (LRR) protein
MPRLLSMPRFRLRTLMAFVIVSSVVFGWIGIIAQRARQQRHIVAELQSYGASIDYSLEVNTSFGRPFEWGGDPPGPEWLRNLVGADFLAAPMRLECIGKGSDDILAVAAKLPSLELIEVGHSNRVTDAGLGQLATLKKLRKLHVSNTSVSDAGLTHLRSLRNLEVLALSHTNVTDAGTKELSGLRNLQEVSLSNTSITDETMRFLEQLPLVGLDVDFTCISDEGVRHIGNMRQMKYLSLANTNISDAGLVHLASLVHLEELNLDNTNISDQSADIFQRFPNLRILSLSNTAIGNATTASVISTACLTELKIAGTNITEQTLDIIDNDPNCLLEKLDIAHTHISWPRYYKFRDRHTFTFGGSITFSDSLVPPQGERK